MSPSEAFHDELERPSVGTNQDGLLPDRLTRACVTVLPFDGAGLSFALTSGRRILLGASDETAATAERLQFALGDGPCTTAHRDETAVYSSEEDLVARWPIYASQLTAYTPYRSTLSLPVGGPLSTVVGLDLYRHRSGRPAPGLLQAVTEIGDLMGSALVEDFNGHSDQPLSLPPALHTPAAEARRQVWRASAHLAGHHQIPIAEGLAVLRSLALLHDSDLETAADRMLSGHLPGPPTPGP